MGPSWRRAAPAVVHATRTAVAAGFSWFVTADLLHNSIPVFAPLAALLTVQVTVWGSVSRGLQRVLGVIAGVLVAYFFARVAGINTWSVGLVILVSLLVGQALRLGPQGSVQVPVSALLVLVLGATTGGYAVDRVLDTAIGAASGILVNLVFVPRSHLPEARAEVVAVALDLSALLAVMGNHLGRSRPGSDASSPYLTQARDLSTRARKALSSVRQAETATRWAPGARRERLAAQHLADAAARLTLAERPVRGIARALADTPASWSLPPALADSLSGLLRTVSSEVVSWADQVATLGEDGGARVPGARAGTSSGDGAPDGTPGGDAGTDVPGGAGTGDGRAEAAFHAVLVAARDAGVGAEMAAVASSVALDAHRVSEEFAGPLRPRPALAGWRELFAP